MKPNVILAAVAETLKQRGDENGYDAQGYDKEERSAAQIAAVYNLITGQAITEADAWLFLACLKLVRIETQIATGKGDILDNCKDLIGYAALRAECVTAADKVISSRLRHDLLPDAFGGIPTDPSQPIRPNCGK